VWDLPCRTFKNRRTAANRAGQPAKRGEYIKYDYLANFDVRQAAYAIDYIKKHAKDSKPFFMDVNFMKMHNPTNASPKFAGKSRPAALPRTATPTHVGNVQPC